MQGKKELNKYTFKLKHSIPAPYIISRKKKEIYHFDRHISEKQPKQTLQLCQADKEKASIKY